MVRRLAAWQRHAPATRRIKTYKSLCRETEARSEATKTRAKLPDCSRAPPRARKPIEACGGPGVSHHPSTPTRLFHRGMQHASEMRSKVRPTVTKAHVNLCQSCTKVWWFSVLAAYGQTRLASARHVGGTWLCQHRKRRYSGEARRGFVSLPTNRGPTQSVLSHICKRFPIQRAVTLLRCAVILRLTLRPVVAQSRYRRLSSGDE